MKHLLCLTIVATVAALIGISGCQRQSADPPKAQVNENPQVQENDPPKLPEPITNSIGMKFAWIPPGNFMMGSPKEEKERHGSEEQHKVTLTKGFYMGIHLVTQEEWRAVIGEAPVCEFKGDKNLPVEWVDWRKCQHFIEESRKKDKKPYRLPTEAEWEYACRAGTTTPFYFGETISTDQANCNGLPYGNGKKGVFRARTTPVGSFPPNAFGLYDMHGNLLQWCQDWYAAFSPDAVVDPQGPHIKEITTRLVGDDFRQHVERIRGNGEFKTLRGGSWGASPGECRSASRGFELAGKTAGTSGSAQYGFRICFFVE